MGIIQVSKASFCEKIDPYNSSQIEHVFPHFILFWKKLNRATSGRRGPMNIT